ncbi:hypothetical protein PR048_028704 [Dryococelus australis]|uniref:Uncharacterized protein n=1 Tax=Dryococelus australis TaxID=614101 RepID=A0ABQ9GBB5_9NEOP|nr:hypothetical protein PR048_028704 [Dryococelus australis]
MRHSSTSTRPDLDLKAPQLRDLSAQFKSATRLRVVSEAFSQLLRMFIAVARFSAVPGDLLSTPDELPNWLIRHSHPRSGGGIEGRKWNKVQYRTPPAIRLLVSGCFSAVLDRLAYVSELTRSEAGLRTVPPKTALSMRVVSGLRDGGRGLEIAVRLPRSKYYKRPHLITTTNKQNIMSRVYRGLSSLACCQLNRRNTRGSTYRWEFVPAAGGAISVAVRLPCCSAHFAGCSPWAARAAASGRLAHPCQTFLSAADQHPAPTYLVTAFEFPLRRRCVYSGYEQNSSFEPCPVPPRPARLLVPWWGRMDDYYSVLQSPEGSTPLKFHGRALLSSTPAAAGFHNWPGCLREDMLWHRRHVFLLQHWIIRALTAEVLRKLILRAPAITCNGSAESVAKDHPHCRRPGSNPRPTPGIDNMQDVHISEEASENAAAVVASCMLGRVLTEARAGSRTVKLSAGTLVHESPQWLKVVTLQMQQWIPSSDIRSSFLGSSSVPGLKVKLFSQVVIAPDDAAGRGVYSMISRFPRAKILEGPRRDTNPVRPGERRALYPRRHHGPRSLLICSPLEVVQPRSRSVLDHCDIVPAVLSRRRFSIGAHSLTELHVIKALICEGFLDWFRLAEGVLHKVWSNDKRIAKRASANVAEFGQATRHWPCSDSPAKSPHLASYALKVHPVRDVKLSLSEFTAGAHYVPWRIPFSRGHEQLALLEPSIAIDSQLLATVQIEMYTMWTLCGVDAAGVLRGTAVWCDVMRKTRLACPPLTRANRIQSPAGSLDSRNWDLCRTMSLVGGPSRGSPVSPAPSFRSRSMFASVTFIDSQDRAVKSLPNLFTHSKLTWTTSLELIPFNTKHLPPTSGTPWPRFENHCRRTTTSGYLRQGFVFPIRDACARAYHLDSPVRQGMIPSNPPTPATTSCAAPAGTFLRIKYLLRTVKEKTISRGRRTTAPAENIGPGHVNKTRARTCEEVTLHVLTAATEEIVDGLFVGSAFRVSRASKTAQRRILRKGTCRVPLAEVDILGSNVDRGESVVTTLMHFSRARSEKSPS